MVALIALTQTRDAFAYLDPGTGSYIFQLIIAGALGAMFTLKIFWAKIKVFFGDLFNRKDKS
ncbi:MAG: hypothetical protein HN356_07075 [Calditrichaeota bacterium]|nr:hypothetical protein [Calditrichota bacterium]MBT7616875.1 hypothetical protein [Calditrichota bacterium]MBT7789291.1 hypothetical protein [Calditrichota bacterium]